MNIIPTTPHVAVQEASLPQSPEVYPNPAIDVLCLKGDRKPLFSGKALAVIRSFKGIPGSARLTVNSELGSAHTDIKVK